jgi:hypothetical protein
MSAGHGGATRARRPAPALALGALAALAFAALAVAACRDRPPPRTELPEVEATRVQAGEVVVDGRLDEPAWQLAGATGPFVDPGSGAHVDGSPVQAQAHLLWDDRALYVAVVVEDRAPSSPFERDARDPHIWAEASGVELMLQPGDPGDNRDYYEVQVDVAGAVWDTRFDDYNHPITGGGAEQRFGHQAWDARLERAVHVERGRGRYTVEMALPWAALESPRAAAPPAPGDVWRLNLYSFRDGQRHALAWSALLGEGNFHRSSRFGRLRFGAAR